MTNFLDEVSAYSCDVPLLNKLRLKVFESIDIHKEYYLGMVKTDNGTVKIWVEGHPAQFWRAEIKDNESGNTYEVKTGSGSLSDFWKSFELMANNMMVVKRKDTP